MTEDGHVDVTQTHEVDTVNVATGEVTVQEQDVTHQDVGEGQIVTETVVATEEGTTQVTKS